MSQLQPEKAARDVAEWDAEIEAEYQRFIRTSNGPGKSSRKRLQRNYTLVPREWELHLLKAKRISTYRLAIELLYLHWYNNGKPVTVSSKVAQAAKISVRSKWEALAELERLGLIEVDRRPRKSPRVVLLHTQTKQT